MAQLETRMLFCERCDNLLYPVTDPDNHMMWLCRACQNCETHDVSLVYQLQLRKELSDTKQLKELAMFADDPTVPITDRKTCPNCKQNRIAWFVNPLEQPVEDMSLFFACTNCRHVWKGTQEQARPETQQTQA